MTVAWFLLGFSLAQSTYMAPQVAGFPTVYLSEYECIEAMRKDNFINKPKGINDDTALICVKGFVKP